MHPEYLCVIAVTNSLSPFCPISTPCQFIGRANGLARVVGSLCPFDGEWSQLQQLLLWALDLDWLVWCLVASGEDAKLTVGCLGWDGALLSQAALERDWLVVGLVGACCLLRRSGSPASAATWVLCRRKSTCWRDAQIGRAGFVTYSPHQWRHCVPIFSFFTQPSDQVQRQINNCIGCLWVWTGCLSHCLIICFSVCQTLTKTTTNTFAIITMISIVIILLLNVWHGRHSRRWWLTN